MLIFDLETDGFLSQVSKIHCLAIHDTEKDETYVYNDEGSQEPITEEFRSWTTHQWFVGITSLGTILPVISKLYPWFTRVGDCLDTLLLSRLYHPNMMEVDKRHKWKHMPLQLYGRHSLESYGYRLGEYKGSFAKDTDWKEWSQDMQDYCVQDVNVTNKLWKHFSFPYLNGSK